MKFKTWRAEEVHSSFLGHHYWENHKGMWNFTFWIGRRCFSVANH